MKPRTKLATVSKQDLAVIDAIVSRALIWFNDREPNDIRMDVIATHLAVPLDLNLLLDFPDTDFVHDIVGIERHLDRQLFVLRQCFLPRCAQPTPDLGKHQ